MAKVMTWVKAEGADMAVRFLVLLSLVFGVFMYASYKDHSACVGRYNDQEAANSRALREAAERERSALDNYLFAIDDARRLPPAEARAKAEAAFDNFVATRREANQARQDNPPPPPPSEQCR